MSHLLLNAFVYYSSSPAAAAAKSLQSCPTLCNPIDGSPPGFPVPEILKGRTLEWVAISFSNAWKWKVKVKSLSHIWLLATPWTVAYQVPPSIGFSRQESWSGLPFPSPDLPDQGLNLGLLHCRQTLYRLSRQGGRYTDDKQIPEKMFNTVSH